MAKRSTKKKAAPALAPYLTAEQAASLVQGEEHRLLIRKDLPAFPNAERKALLAAVSAAETFDDALKIIAVAAERIG